MHARPRRPLFEIGSAEARGLNFASNLPLLDLLFGTAGELTPPGAEPLGIAGDAERY